MDTPVKAYTVYNEDTKKIIYQGNDLLKTISAIYCGQPTSIRFEKDAHKIILKYAVQIQEQLN